MKRKNLQPVLSLEEERPAANEALAIVKRMQEISLRNGNSEMTLDEINEEIAKTRKEKKNHQQK